MDLHSKNEKKGYLLKLLSKKGVCIFRTI